MHVSPSTLSRQIQRLEEDLGQPLFVRDNRTVTLTEAGERAARFRPANAVAVSAVAPHHRSARAVALWRITYLLLGDRCLQPSAADSGSLPRGTPVGGD
ncbi:LysR family transcriptional regulator [Escherichia coli]